MMVSRVLEDRNRLHTSRDRGGASLATVTRGTGLILAESAARCAPRRGRLARGCPVVQAVRTEPCDEPICVRCVGGATDGTAGIKARATLGMLQARYCTRRSSGTATLWAAAESFTGTVQRMEPTLQTPSAPSRQ